jgi:hypothetical protein
MACTAAGKDRSRTPPARAAFLQESGVPVPRPRFRKTVGGYRYKSPRCEIGSRRCLPATRSPTHSVTPRPRRRGGHGEQAVSWLSSDSRPRLSPMLWSDLEAPGNPGLPPRFAGEGTAAIRSSVIRAFLSDDDLGELGASVAQGMPPAKDTAWVVGVSGHCPGIGERAGIARIIPAYLGVMAVSGPAPRCCRPPVG